MPSRSPAQHRLMEAAAHTQGGLGGVPQGVARDFVAADEKKEREDGKREAAAKPRNRGATKGYGR